MGGAASSAESEEEEFHIPPGQEWKHINCTVRARHQLIIKSSKEINYCDYCEACKLHFCFNRHRNHFKLWHSPQCDHLPGYTRHYCLDKELVKFHKFMEVSFPT